VTLRMEYDELRITTMKRRIERARRRIRRYVKPGVSLADELIAECREGQSASKLALRGLLAASGHNLVPYLHAVSLWIRLHSRPPECG
jgi:hypothetical protein